MQEQRTLSAEGSAVRITAVSQTPYIVDDGGVLKSETRLSVGNGGPAFECWVEVRVKGKPPCLQPVGTIPPGPSDVVAYVEELYKDGDEVTFRLFGNERGQGASLAAVALKQKKVRHWKVYVAHDTHMDIGFTHYQEYLRHVRWPEYLDGALKFMDDTDGRAEEEQFRHHIESSYMLYGSALGVRDDMWVEKLKQRLAQGRLAYSASPMNLSLEAMGAEQLVRCAYYSQRHLKDMLDESSSAVWMMRDNPSVCWAAVDVFAGVGVKYFYFGPNFNGATPRTVTEAYPRVFYIEGRKPKNRVLFVNGTLYNFDEMQFVPDGPEGIPVPLDVTVRCVANSLMNTYHRADYPYDAVVEDVAQYWDNGLLYPDVMERVRQMNGRCDAQGRPYLYPRFMCSNLVDFYRYVEKEYSPVIPAFRGTFENWWNFGIPSAAYEEGEVRTAHDLVPAAELLATAAHLACREFKYPVKKLSDAWSHMMLYDEHTFGPMTPAVGDQHIWKRNTALTARRLADGVANDSLTALSALIPAEGLTVAVFNPLAWARTDVVRTKPDGLPTRFDIVDLATSAVVKYQRTSSGEVEFIAEDVPGPGYKCFRIMERPDEPVFRTGITKTKNTLENEYYRVTFSSEGDIASILDKHRGVELVDESSPYRMNEFLYMLSGRHSYELKSPVHRVGNATVSIEAGAISGRMASLGFCPGTAGVERQVILYNGIPRIDIVNTVYKTDAPAWRTQDEEGFFTFPLNVPGFTLRHELPAGDVRPHVTPDIHDPETEQFYTSSTDFYTVNRWIDASSLEAQYGVTLSSVSAPMVQYGERRSLLYDVGYNTENPWVYSYVFNNKWACNFMDTQPGPVTFRYSITSHGGGCWQAGRADRFGRERSLELLPVVIPEAQKGTGFDAAAGRWMEIEADNVALTAVKPAEANGEGVILRFNETLGRDTQVTVDVSFFGAAEAFETDLVENDIAPLKIKHGKVSFSIDCFGWKTIRLLRAVSSGLKGGHSQAARAVSGAIEAAGPSSAPVAFRVDFAFANRVSLSWLEGGDGQCVKGYKVYRDGREIASLASILNSYLDTAVQPGRTYRYTVCAVDLRGGLSEAAGPAVAAVAKGKAAPGNIAPQARVFASSQFSAEYPAEAVTDGLTGFTSQWASAGELNPWIRLIWDEPHTVSRVVVYDRDADVDCVNRGVLHFSDGSAVPVEGVPRDGMAKAVDFPARSIDWLEFRVTGGRGINVGLSEIEVFKAKEGKPIDDCP